MTAAWGTGKGSDETAEDKGDRQAVEETMAHVTFGEPVVSQSVERVASHYK